MAQARSANRRCTAGVLIDGSRKARVAADRHAAVSAAGRDRPTDPPPPSRRSRPAGPGRTGTPPARSSTSKPSPNRSSLACSANPHPASCRIGARALVACDTGRRPYSADAGRETPSSDAAATCSRCAGSAARPSAEAARQDGVEGADRLRLRPHGPAWAGCARTPREDVEVHPRRRSWARTAAGTGRR